MTCVPDEPISMPTVVSDDIVLAPERIFLQRPVVVIEIMVVIMVGIVGMRDARRRGRKDGRRGSAIRPCSFRRLPCFVPWRVGSSSRTGPRRSMRRNSSPPGSHSRRRRCAARPEPKIDPVHRRDIGIVAADRQHDMVLRRQHRIGRIEPDPTPPFLPRLRRRRRTTTTPRHASHRRLAAAARRLAARCADSR